MLREEHLGTSRAEAFVGWRDEGDVPLILNARSGVAPAGDKSPFAIFAHARRLPVPRLKAVYCPGTSTAIAEVSCAPPTPRRLDILHVADRAYFRWYRVQQKPK